MDTTQVKVEVEDDVAINVEVDVEVEEAPKVEVRSMQSEVWRVAYAVFEVCRTRYVGRRIIYKILDADFVTVNSSIG